jgi:GWxTD domain-containing protein
MIAAVPAVSRQRPPRARRGRSIVPAVLLLLTAAGIAVSQSDEDWASSPEAYFLTKEERSEWKTVDSRDLRQKFIERYWLKRDPTPGTEKNEFHEMVLARIKTADSRFKIEKTPGSRTARGQVFIVLGSPARFRDDLSPKPPPDRPRQLGVGVTPVALVEGNETTSTWSYDPDRTPRILEVLHRANLQIKIVVEPSRHMDAVQDPGLFNDVKETVARASIVNPDLVPPPPGGEAPAVAMPLLPHQPLAAAVRQVLEAAPASRADGAFVNSAVVFRDGGGAETLLWVFTPRASRKPRFHALIRGEDGREVATMTEPAEISNAFSTRSSGGMVAMHRLSLPPGSYSAALALTDPDGKPLAAGTLPVQVPALEGFAVSSLIITRGPAQATPSAGTVFQFGGTLLPPRADAAFAASESLWYFLEVANPTDPAKVMLEPRLRRGGEPLAGLPPFAAILQTIGPKRYVAGVELPLSSLGPGDYVLYLGVRDGETEDRPRVLRRADFQVVR